MKTVRAEYNAIGYRVTIEDRAALPTGSLLTVARELCETLAQRLADEHGATLTELDEYDEAGNHVAHTQAGDPTHPDSWTKEFDSDGYCIIAYTQSGDPSHPLSWRREYNADGDCISYTQAGDPTHRYSQRMEN